MEVCLPVVYGGSLKLWTLKISKKVFAVSFAERRFENAE